MELIRENIYLIRNNFLFESNTYLIITEDQKSCVIIDPGLDTKTILSQIQSLSVTPVAIISTHAHFDHIGEVMLLREKYKCPYYIHRADLKLYKSANFYLNLMKINLVLDLTLPDIYFDDIESSVYMKDIELKIIHTPGHSPGSCIILYKKYLFVGDTIYAEGIGLGTIPKENSSQLKKSINQILSFFEDEILILPGHGKFSTLADIKKNNVKLFNYINLKDE